MKKLEFEMRNVNIESGINGEPIEVVTFSTLSVPDTEAGRAYAEEYSWNGVITPFEDDEPEEEAPQSAEERIAELEEALRLLLEGATE